MKKKTNKLFFEKFVNKVSITTPLANQFRGRNLTLTKDKVTALLLKLIASDSPSISTNIWNSNPKVNQQQIENAIELIEIFDKLDQNEFTIRVEGSILGFYFNDDMLIDKIEQVKNIRIREISTVSDEKTREYLLATPKSIIRKEYTHKYRVTIANLGNDYANFISWAERLPKIKLSKNRKYIAGGVFYVADTKTLMMCKVFLGDKIRKIEELVNINEI